MMRKWLLLFVAMVVLPASARHKVMTERIQSLQVVVNDDWLSPPVMRLGEGDVLNISFDELSHDYHRFVYHIEHCDPDWNTTQDIFESDFLDGFNDNPIENYEHSWNTVVLYTHYTLQIPNERCRLKMSGNYRLRVFDEDNDNEEVFVAEFMVCDQSMRVGLEVTTNTDVDHNDRHQQLSMSLDYGSLSVININQQIRTLVTQNGSEFNARRDVRPNLITGRGLVWQHNKDYIFPAGNEYHKYEILATSHPTMGIDAIEWDGHNYHAYPFLHEERHNYLNDMSANGAFYIRNSDNRENDITCEYVYVHYKLKAPHTPGTRMLIDGWWTTSQKPHTSGVNSNDMYAMDYDTEDNTYNAVILQKQGYYSYRFLLETPNGIILPPSEGCFYQTQNRYQAYVYYREIGGRAWRLVANRQIILDNGLTN